MNFIETPKGTFGNVTRVIRIELLLLLILLLLLLKISLLGKAGR